MTKKEYQKPVMEVIEAGIEQQILAYSVQTTGLGDDDLALPEGEEPKSENPWDFAW